MPESTGVPTLGDVLTWWAEQGAPARACKLSEEEWTPKLLERIREVARRAGEAPANLRETVLNDPSEFIAFVLHSEETSDELTSLDDQLRMTLDHLIGNYGSPVGEAFEAPLNPHADIPYVCREDLQTEPPAWAMDYFKSWPPLDARHTTIFVIEED